MLYLNVGEPRPAARGLETPHGHSIHYDESGAVIGITLLTCATPSNGRDSLR